MSYETDPWSPTASPEPEQTTAAPVQSLPIPDHEPLWTWVLLGINVLVWLAMTLMGGSEDSRILVLFGAKYHPLIIAGEYWRLLTANFIHIGMLHLALNSWALYLFGVQTERRYGRARFIVLYLLSGIGGTVLSFLGSRALSAGASGAIFGLIGAITVYYAVYRKAFGDQGKNQLTSLLLIMGFNLVWGFVNPGIDNLGHVGGLVTGLALGWAYCPRYQVVPTSDRGLELQDRFSRARAVAVTIIVIVVLLALTWLGTLIHTRGI